MSKCVKVGACSVCIMSDFKAFCHKLSPDHDVLLNHLDYFFA